MRLRCALPVGIVSYQLALRALPAARPLLHILIISCGCDCIEVAVASACARRGRSRQEDLRRCGRGAVAACNCNCNCYSSLAELIAREKVYRGLDFASTFFLRKCHMGGAPRKVCQSFRVKGQNRRGSMSVLGMLEATLPLSPCLDLHTSECGPHGTGFRGLRLVS